MDSAWTGRTGEELCLAPLPFRACEAPAISVPCDAAAQSQLSPLSAPLRTHCLIVRLGRPPRGHPAIRLDLGDIARLPLAVPARIALSLRLGIRVIRLDVSTWASAHVPRPLYSLPSHLGLPRHGLQDLLHIRLEPRDTLVCAPAASCSILCSFSHPYPHPLCSAIISHIRSPIIGSTLLVGLNPPSETDIDRDGRPRCACAGPCSEGADG